MEIWRKWCQFIRNPINDFIENGFWAGDLFYLKRNPDRALKAIRRGRCAGKNRPKMLSTTRERAIRIAAIIREKTPHYTPRIYAIKMIYPGEL